MAPLRSPADVRVDMTRLVPIEVSSPEVLAPLARAIHHGKCPACGSAVHGVEDSAPDGSARIQITCFGNPAHAFFFDAGTGHIANQPAVMGEVKL